MELMKMTKVRFESSNPSNRNKQSGFAIGVVFLVLVLIGAIMSAITLMSSASQDTSRDNENRSLANGIIRDGAGIANAVNTLISANGLRVEQVFMFRDSTNTAVFNRSQNILGPKGSTNFPQLSPTAYSFTGCTQTILGTEAAASASLADTCMLYMTRVKTTNYGQGGDGLRDSTYMLYTAPLTEAVAKQVNNLLWQSGSAEILPSIAAATPAALQKLAPPTTVGAPTSLQAVTVVGTAAAVGTPYSMALPTINGSVRPEGIYSLDTTAPQTRNIYYKVYSSY
jgi:hypothetical protein